MEHSASWNWERPSIQGQADHAEGPIWIRRPPCVKGRLAIVVRAGAKKKREIAC